MDHKIDFKEWFWGKFEEWRKGTTNGPTAFARYLDITQQNVSGWLNGKYKPKSAEHFAKIAAKYPEVYDLFGFPKPEFEDVPFDQWPLDIKRRLTLADAEINALFKENAITDTESAEAVQIVIEVMEKHGFKYTDSE